MMHRWRKRSCCQLNFTYTHSAHRTSASCWPVLQSTTSPVPSPVSATTRPLGTLFVGRAGPPKPLPTTPREEPPLPFFFFFFLELRFFDFPDPCQRARVFGMSEWGVWRVGRVSVGGLSVRFHLFLYVAGAPWTRCASRDVRVSTEMERATR